MPFGVNMLVTCISMVIKKVFHALLNAFPILWFDWGIQGAKLAG